MIGDIVAAFFIILAILIFGVPIAVAIIAWCITLVWSILALFVVGPAMAIARVRELASMRRRDWYAFWFE